MKTPKLLHHIHRVSLRHAGLHWTRHRSEVSCDIQSNRSDHVTVVVRQHLFTKTQIKGVGEWHKDTFVTPCAAESPVANGAHLVVPLANTDDLLRVCHSSDRSFPETFQEPFLQLWSPYHSHCLISVTPFSTASEVFFRCCGFLVRLTSFSMQQLSFWRSRGRT